MRKWPEIIWLSAGSCEHVDEPLFSQKRGISYGSSSNKRQYKTWCSKCWIPYVSAQMLEVLKTVEI